MSKKNDKEIIILCEDLAHYLFIREYLIERGFNKDRIKRDSRGYNNASVINQYPKLIKAYRSQKNYKRLAIIVMIDADEKTISERLKEIHTALNQTDGELNRDTRLKDEEIAIFIPDRNIETWFYYINFDRNCSDDKEDYKKGDKGKEMMQINQINLAKNSAKKLHQEICTQGIHQIALESLRHACNELQRIIN
jgi:hypothetical protein